MNATSRRALVPALILSVLPPAAWAATLEPIVFAGERLDPARAVKRAHVPIASPPAPRSGRVADPALPSDTCIPLEAGDKPIVLPLAALQPSLYAFYIHGSIAANGRAQLDRVWRPCPMAFGLRDAGKKVVAEGRMLLKQGLAPRRMQGFFAQVVVPGDYVASFALTDAAQEQAEITAIVVQDLLKGLPDEAVKTGQNIANGKTSQLLALTAERAARDERIWNAVPPLNVHLQMHAQVAEFRNPPAGLKAPAWTLRSLSRGHPNAATLFSPLEFVNRETGEVFAADQVAAGVPWPGPVPDDGTGVFFARKDHPDLKQDIYYCPRAVALGQHYAAFLGLLGVWDHRSLSLAKRYFEGGDPNVGHDAAMALVRLAWDFPAIEMNLHEIRLSTHAPDFEFNADWSVRRVGKYFYDGWASDNFNEMMIAYDQVFPYIKDNQVFADAVHRFIPWVRTPQDVVRFLDRYVVFAGLRDTHERRLIRGSVEDTASIVLGPHRTTMSLFDLTRLPAEIYPARGRYQELYGTALPRNGAYYIGSFLVYAFGSAAGTVERAHSFAIAKAKGITPPMDLSDVERYPKVRAAGQFLLDIFTAGGYPLTVGDASGGPHAGLEAEKRLRSVRNASAAAFDLWRDPRHAWLLKHLHGDTRPEVAQAAGGVKNPLMHQYSRIVPNEAAVVELGSDETEIVRKSSMMLRLGVGQGHAHNDQLDLNLWGLGLPVAVDLACRSEGGNWSRPSASYSFLHNHAIAHADVDPRPFGGRTGEPWLTAFAPPLLRGRYVSQNGSETLDRDVILMEVGDGAATYAFDLQRLSGNKLHTWCFHGCPAEALRVNTEVKEAEALRWTDRCLEGTRKAGKSPETLQAVWTMTRKPLEYPHNFTGGGVVRQPACEQAILGPRFDAALPEVRVRATLLGHPGEDVMQANPYSQSYTYCYPFLWVQRPADGGESVYPAIYEWYRGETPTVQKAELVSREPVVVKVTTASGQADTFTADGAALTAVSRDGRGLRWAQLNGGVELKDGDLTVRAQKARHEVAVADVDYRRRRLTTGEPLPPDPVVAIGNPGRWSNLVLQGAGTRFTYADDPLIHEGEVTSIQVTPPDRVEVKSNQNVLFGDFGNRKLAGLTVSNEDNTWLFRGGKALRWPAGAVLSDKVFTDANGDGLVNVKTYEFGPGDTIQLPSNVIVRRTPAGYEAMTNVPVELTLQGRTTSLQPSAGWQAIPGKTGS